MEAHADDDGAVEGGIGLAVSAAVEPEDLWLLRFRPAELEPPRWFRRGRPAVGRADSGWRGLFGYEVTDLLWAVAAAGEGSGGATLEALRQWGVLHHRTAGWLEQPLIRPQPQEVDPADVARQLGVPAPTRLAGVLDLFVAAGLLVLDEGGYRQVAVPPNPEDVLHLPVERTLVPEADVRAALRWAEHRGLLRVEGSVDGKFVMTC